MYQNVSRLKQCRFSNSYSSNERGGGGPDSRIHWQLEKSPSTNGDGHGWSSAFETAYDVNHLCKKQHVATCTWRVSGSKHRLANIIHVCIDWTVFVDYRILNFGNSHEISASPGPVNCPSHISGELTGGPRQSYPSPLLWRPPPWCATPTG